jgi:hypothetical protein
VARCHFQISVVFFTAKRASGVVCRVFVLSLHTLYFPANPVEIANQECYNMAESIVGVDVCEKESLSTDSVGLDAGPAGRLRRPGPAS